jgi:hypothetical protein
LSDSISPERTSPQAKNLTARIAIITAFLVGVAALLDALIAVTTKTESLLCTFSLPLPWCPGQPKPSPPPSVLPRTTLPKEPFTPPTAFAIQVNLLTAPGAPVQTARRDWKLFAPNTWVEIYPDGRQYVYDVVGRFALENCPGTAVKEKSEAHWAFITDKGCVGSPLYISRDGKNWGFAATMTELQ